MFSFILGLGIGAVVGALAFRNNAAKAGKIVEQAKLTLDADRAVARNILADLNKK